MKIVVLKFGGTSVGTIKKIKKVAEIIAGYKEKNYKVIVVSSAMSGVTNELIKKSRDISESFSDSEYENVASTALSMDIAGDGFFTGYSGVLGLGLENSNSFAFNFRFYFFSYLF